MKIAGRGARLQLSGARPRGATPPHWANRRLAGRLRLFSIAGALGDQIRRGRASSLVLSTAAPISWTAVLAFWPAVAQFNCSKQRLSLDAPSHNQLQRSAPISRPPPALALLHASHAKAPLRPSPSSPPRVQSSLARELPRS